MRQAVGTDRQWRVVQPAALPAVLDQQPAVGTCAPESGRFRRGARQLAGDRHSWNANMLAAENKPPPSWTMTCPHCSQAARDCWHAATAAVPSCRRRFRRRRSSRSHYRPGHSFLVQRPALAPDDHTRRGDGALSAHVCASGGGTAAGSSTRASGSRGVTAMPHAARRRNYELFGPRMVRRHFNLPPPQRGVCGISFGYPDTEHPANGFRTARAALEDVVTWAR